MFNENYYCGMETDRENYEERAEFEQEQKERNVFAENVWTSGTPIEQGRKMFTDPDFIGALCVIAIFAGQVPGFIRLLRDTQNGYIICDMRKRKQEGATSKIGLWRQVCFKQPIG